MKRHFLFALLMLCMAWTSSAEEALMKIEFMAGYESFSLASIGKITFDNNMMILWDNAGNELGSTSLDLIDKIEFIGDDQTTSITDVSTPGIQVFPNPTQGTLFIRGVEGQQTVRIFNMQGQVLQSALSTDGEANLPVGGLQSGTYLLQIGAQVVKFIKE